MTSEKFPVSSVLLALEQFAKGVKVEDLRVGSDDPALLALYPPAPETLYPISDEMYAAGLQAYEIIRAEKLKPSDALALIYRMMRTYDGQ